MCASLPCLSRAASCSCWQGWRCWPEWYGRARARAENFMQPRILPHAWGRMRFSGKDGVEQRPDQQILEQVVEGLVVGFDALANETDAAGVRSDAALVHGNGWTGPPQ